MHGNCTLVQDAILSNSSPKSNVTVTWQVLNACHRHYDRVNEVRYAPLYILHISADGVGGEKYLHFWGFGAEYWYLLLHFLLFLRVFGPFFEVFV